MGDEHRGRRVKDTLTLALILLVIALTSWWGAHHHF